MSFCNFFINVYCNAFQWVYVKNGPVCFAIVISWNHSLEMRDCNNILIEEIHVIATKHLLLWQQSKWKLITISISNCLISRIFGNTNWQGGFCEFNVHCIFTLRTKTGGGGIFHTSSPNQNFLEAVSIRKTVLPGMAIPMLKIRRPNGRLIFNMEIAIRR